MYTEPVTDLLLELEPLDPGEEEELMFHLMAPDNGSFMFQFLRGLQADVH